MTPRERYEVETFGRELLAALLASLAVCSPAALAALLRHLLRAW